MQQPEDPPDPLKKLLDKLAVNGRMDLVSAQVENDGPAVIVCGHRRVQALRCLSEPDPGEPQPGA